MKIDERKWLESLAFLADALFEQTQDSFYQKLFKLARKKLGSKNEKN